jgi:hypothetical protein
LNINTLVGDIYTTLEGKAPYWGFSSLDLTSSLQEVYKKSNTIKERPPKTLYFSEIGDPCPRKLHYRFNSPQLAEKHDGNTLIKFFYGNMLEDFVLAVTEGAGHEVTSRQGRATLELDDGWKVTGKIDAVIDGVLVDVKSTTKYGEEKFKHGLVDDPFGYALQLGGYAVALGHTSAGFLTIQKELGHLGWYPITVDKNKVISGAQAAVKAVTSDITELPRLSPVPQSKTSKNMKLCTSCGYCPYKKQCWPEMRTFLYSNSVEHLVYVDTEPRVLELK